MSIIGIDFGNYKCTVAYISGNNVEILLDENTNRYSKNIISIKNSERFFGDIAQNMINTNFKGTFHKLKDLLLKNKIDKYITYDVEKNSDNITCIKHNNELYTCEQIIAMMISNINDHVKSSFNRNIFDYTISVPSSYNIINKMSILDACQISGNINAQIINENVAVSISYGLWKLLKNEFKDNEKNIMFIDMGESHTTITITKYLNRNIDIISTENTSDICSRSFDHVIFNYLANLFLEKKNLNIFDNKKSINKLLRESEKIKKTFTLNGIYQHNINIDYLMGDKSINEKIDINIIDSLYSPIINRIKKPINDCIINSGITINDIDSIELIGGGTRISQVKKFISELLQSDLSNKLNSDECIANGCALYSTIMSNRYNLEKINITQKTMKEIKLLIIKELDETSINILNIGDKLPLTKKIRICCKDHLSLILIEDNNIISEYNIMIPKDNISKKLNIYFKIDINGIPKCVKISQKIIKEELSDNKESKKKTTYTHVEFNEKIYKSMNDEVLIDAIKKECVLKNKHLLTKEKQKKKNELESLIYNVQSQINDDLNNYITDDENNNIIQLLEDFENIIYDEELLDTSEYEKHIIKLNSVVEIPKHKKQNRIDINNKFIDIYTKLKSFKEQIKINEHLFDKNFLSDLNIYINTIYSNLTNLNDNIKKTLLCKSINDYIDILDDTSKEFNKYVNDTLNYIKENSVTNTNQIN